MVCLFGRRTVVVRFGVLAALVVAACRSGDVAGVGVGTLMTVAEQVGIEAALDRAADTVVRRGRTPGDTLLANYVRIVARLVRLQGRQGGITAVAPGAAGSPLALHGVALAAVAATAGTPAYVHILVGWDGLDPVAFTVRHLVVAVVDGGAMGAGTFTLPPGAAGVGARFVDLTAASATVLAVSSGTLTVGAPAFGGTCPGLTNTTTNSCETGSESVSGSFAMPGGPLDLSAPSPLPAFRLTTH